MTVWRPTQGSSQARNPGLCDPIPLGLSRTAYARNSRLSPFHPRDQSLLTSAPTILKHALGILTLASALMLAAVSPAAEQRPLQVSAPSFALARFDPAAPVAHTFYFNNSGADMIQVERIAVTPPLQVIKVLSKIPPNGDGQLIVSLGTPRQLGEYEGAIEISFKNKDLAPLRL